MKKVKIGDKELYNFSEPYIIAEIGSNHNGDMDLAKEIIDAAVDSGADAVKFQSWTPTSLIAEEEYDRNQSYDDSPKKHFGSLREMVEKYYLREEQHYELKKYCDENGIAFSSSAFSKEEADLVEDCGVPFFKVASMDINNLDLLRHLATKDKPVILSTGMATLAEIDRAVDLLEKNNCEDIILLHCIAIYPPAYEDINLNNITMLQKAFGLPVGFSDHSIGTSIPLASVALGSCVIEKHFTLDKDLPGWDHEISADPPEMKIICEESRNINKSLGSFRRKVSEAEEGKKKKFRRSIVVQSDLEEGHVLTEEDLTSKRPGTGISPDMLEHLVGRTLKTNIDKDTVLEWEHIS